MPVKKDFNLHQRQKISATDVLQKSNNQGCNKILSYLEKFRHYYNGKFVF